MFFSVVMIYYIKEEIIFMIYLSNLIGYFTGLEFAIFLAWMPHCEWVNTLTMKLTYEEAHGVLSMHYWLHPYVTVEFANFLAWMPHREWVNIFTMNLMYEEVHSFSTLEFRQFIIIWLHPYVTEYLNYVNTFLQFKHSKNKKHGNWGFFKVKMDYGFEVD